MIGYDSETNSAWSAGYNQGQEEIARLRARVAELEEFVRREADKPFGTEARALLAQHKDSDES